MWPPIWNSARLAANESTYVAHLRLRKFVLLKVADFPGLVASQTLTGTPTEVLTFWRTQEDYERNKDALQTALDDPVELVARHVRVASSKRAISLWGWFVALLGVLGTLEGLRTHHEWLFAAPRLSLMPMRPLPLDHHESATFVETIHVANYTSVAHNDIAVTAARLVGTNATVQLDAEPQTLPRLAPGGATAIFLSGELPSPGSYKLVLTTASLAGVFPGRDEQETRLPVTVWSDVPDLRWIKQSTRERRILLVGELQTGRTANAGVDCVVTLVNRPEVHRVVASGPELTVSRPFEMRADRQVGTVKISWPPREKFSRTRFKFVISADAVTDWTNVRASLTSACSHSRKDGSDD